MIAEEIFKKIRKIEIISKKSAQSVFAGQYHSAFKGRGIEFAEVREYQPGDDIRFIDGNVSSRLGKLFVKRFAEERQLTIILAIDLSSSLNFFSENKSKKEIAAEMAALIAFTAMLNNDKVGLLIFTDRIELFIPAKKGKTHLLRMIRDILDFTPSGRGTAIANALEYLNQALKKRAVVFLISDFLDDGFITALKIASRKHDLIAVTITDQRELIPPDKGIFIFRDWENDSEFYADFNQPAARRALIDFQNKRTRRLNETFKKYGIDHLKIEHERDFEKALFDLFSRRRKKYSR